jgi:UDP-N-acetylglucosamine:LPS N-acetylglucosamine transferase
VRTLFGDPARLQSMSEKAAALARPEGADSIARRLLALGKQATP